ncbi:hypothetical protein T484DRAFT_1897198 [Baffinella frigidus]|nr:hypothetical protein T484DRAFT_1897198 [Cryptophyta sp. CCMP2293]
MLIEAMVVTGLSFTVLCGYASTGHVDQVAEDAGWQEKGELTRWQSKNEFQYKDLYDMDAFVEDIKEEMRMESSAEQEPEKDPAKEN